MTCSTLQQKKSGLTIVNVIPFRSIIAETESFESALLYLDSLQKDMYRHAKVQLDDISGYLAEKYDVPMGCTYQTTWLTCQPCFDLASCGLKFQAQKFLENGIQAPGRSLGDLIGMSM